MWQTQIPSGNKVELAKMLFCMENPPGTKNISGSQDQLGIILPGLNKLNYNNGYWPDSIESKTDEETLSFISRTLQLIALPPRQAGYDVMKGVALNAPSARKLADASEKCWNAISAKDIKLWGEAMKECFAAQLELFPAMMTPEVAHAIEEYKDRCAGWKLSGCGGGGYLLLVSDTPIPGALKIVPRS
jgi:galactokinase/mevalonate kinase-like predicted kinase